MKIQEFDDKDFLSFITVKQVLSDQSIRHCMSRFKLIKKWFGSQELSKENVEKFYLYLKKQKKLNNNSLNTYNFAFRHLVDYSKDRGFPFDFFDGFNSFKKVKPDIIILTIEEIDRIINTKLEYGDQYGKDMSFLDFRYRTLVMFLAETGCRHGEALKLLVKRVDIDAGRATFVNTKTNENRSVYITDPLKSSLAKLIEGRKPDDHVFRNSREVQVRESDFSQDLKRRAEKAGVTKRVHPHIFRHCYATHMLEAGVPETQVASLGGWKDIRTLYEVYAHLADRTLRQAAMRHPLVRRNIDPREILKIVKEGVEKLHLDEDGRFKFDISENNKKLSIILKVL